MVVVAVGLAGGGGVVVGGDVWILVEDTDMWSVLQFALQMFTLPLTRCREEKR